MGIFQHLCVEDHEEGSGPLLAEAGSIESSPAASGRPEPREFFLSPKKNLALSLVLLFASYSALLVPAYLPVQHPIWSDGSTDEDVLKHSAAMLARTCNSGWAVARLKKMPGFRSLLEIPVFLQNATGGWDLAPPLGLQGSEEMLAHTLSALPLSGLPFSPDRCRRCIVVGSGGILRGKHLGDHIDKYDIIIRMNNAPVFGFEKDAGSRTTIRLVYPEGAPILNQEYHNTEIIALVVFKRLDLEWLLSVVTNEPLSWWSKLWFWKNVVNEIPLPPGNFRITNPEILNRTWHLLLTYNKQQRKTVPTLGLIGVVLALQLCDEVSLAGFGYDLQQPGARLHYYEALRMDTMMSQVVHDVTTESSLLQELVKARVLHDLTGVL
ncbi:ST3 beta-galactoside alpha-2,3-sialyltransferase 7 [Electrophorus electricus]|uniref:Lactosylceramide alpha-2,3-sialyltransferase n=1 Tax=Electrophorus electricus TaxID=8005 RepID=A0A4W4E3V4_ELEEL|nr:ST3 beta-galactoside alpha-2,3-sialyltransferase 7 [Electrophorus electricus]